MSLALLLLGVACLVLVFWDVFETVLVPRPTPGRLRLARHLTRVTWRAWRGIALRVRAGGERERLLGLYAPANVIALLGLWLVVLVVGYGLIFMALRDQLQPPPTDLGNALYFAGTSIMTLGFGDIVASGVLARVVTLLAAATGLGVVAVVLTYLFSLFASFQRREILVVTLEARAGAPPSPVALLETYAALGIVDDLRTLFADWEAWSAEVLDSHVAYPILAFFRSSHDNLSWISALGAVLDATSLVLTTVRGVPRGPAELTARVGRHFVEDISNFLGFGETDAPLVDQDMFEQAYRRLEAAGYELEELEHAWLGFERARAAYGARLEALAHYWTVPSTLWIGERIPLPTGYHEAAPGDH
jgi:hypothetical protein